MRFESEVVDDSQFSKKYDIIKKLGQGCFGKIYKVRNKQLKIHTALKLEVTQKNVKKSMVQNEAQLFKLIQGKPFAPQFYNFGRWELGTFIELQLLERDLNSFVDKTFSYEEITVLTVKLLNSLLTLHNANIIHQDIKPQNIMLNSKGEYFFIDLGISKKLNPQAVNLQNQAKRGKGFIGTPRYASIAAHRGLEQSKKDDLESLMYNIAYLYFKKLPWLSLKVAGKRRIEEIKSIKQKTAENVFQQMGEPFNAAFKYIKKLASLEEPNYKFLINLFKRVNSMIVDPSNRNQQDMMDMPINNKKYSFDLIQNQGKYLQLPLMGKDSENAMTSQRAVGLSPNKSGSTMNTAVSKGNSMQVYNQTDEITQADDESFQMEMKINDLDDKEPVIKNVAKFSNPLLLKNPFSGRKY